MGEVEVFYREADPADEPVLLLLHSAGRETFDYAFDSLTQLLAASEGAFWSAA